MDNFSKLKFKKNLYYFWYCLILFAISSFPLISNWLSNRYQVTAADLVLPIILNSITALVVGAIFWRQYKQNNLIGVLTGGFTILFLTHQFANRLNAAGTLIKTITPFASYSTGVSFFQYLFFLILVIAIIMYFSHRLIAYFRNQKWELVIWYRSVIITVITIFIVQSMLVIKIVIAEWAQFSYRPPTLSANLNTTNKPDIYYIVLDRYANQNVLKTQFNFDNGDFLNYLDKNGFTVNNDAHSNYPFTTMSISSTMNANYQSDIVQKFGGASEQTLEPFHDSIRYSSVIQSLKSAGYKFIQLGSWYEASNQAPLADQNHQPDGQLIILNHTFTLNDFAKNHLTNSWIGQIVSRGLNIGHFSVLGYSQISEADATLYKIQHLKDFASQSAGGRVIFAHFLIPHEPYLFNADGSYSTNPTSDSVGKPIKTKYTDQIKFINSQMKTVIDQINKSSSNQAIIVLQADEGAYPMQMNGQLNGQAIEEELSASDMRNWSDADLQMKYGVLAAYHIPKASAAQIQTSADSVNVFRLIFNTYFDAKMDYLPKCYYAYPNGRAQSFVFADITKRLTGSDNSSCPTNSNFK